MNPDRFFLSGLSLCFLRSNFLLCDFSDKNITHSGFGSVFYFCSTVMLTPSVAKAIFPS